MNSDENKLYMKIVDLDEIYNFVVQTFLFGAILELKTFLFGAILELK